MAAGGSPCSPPSLDLQPASFPPPPTPCPAEAARVQAAAAAARGTRIPNRCDLRVYAVTDPDCNAQFGRTNAGGRVGGNGKLCRELTRIEHKGVVHARSSAFRLVVWAAFVCV